MICAMSLAGPIKKVYGNKCMQISAAKAVANLVLDPAESGIDALVVQPRDVSSFGAKNLVAAIEDRHEKIKVIYIYSKESDASKLDDVLKYRINRITPDEIKEAIDEALADKALSEKNIIVASNDKQILSGEKGRNKRAQTIKALKENIESRNTEEVPLNVEDETDEEEDDVVTLSSNEEDSEDIKKAVIEEPIEEEVEIQIPKTSPIETVKVEPEVKNISTIEDRIKNIKEFNDWGVLKEALNVESMKIELMNESAQYAGCVNYMTVIEQRVNTIFKDENLPVEEKMFKIRELGVEKSGIKAQVNNILVDKYNNIIDAITNLVVLEMDKKISNIKNSLNKLVVKQDFFTREEDVRELIDKRLEIQVGIGELMQGIVQTYKIMNNSSQEIIKGMDEDLPTESKFVNEIMKSYDNYFKPENAATLFLKITRAVEEKRLILSSVEDKLESLFRAVFKLIEVDSNIIENYQNKLDIFKAQNTEEVVVMTTMLKSALRVYVAPKDVGLTTTALTLSGCQARRRNTILLDLREGDKLSQYKINFTDLNELLTTNVEQDLVICKEHVTELDRLEEILTKLNDKLYYYFNINIIIDESQLEFINRMGKDLRTIIYVSNCTKSSLLTLKEIASSTKLENVAQKVILIAPPIDATRIAIDAGIDVTRCQVTSIPYMVDVARCTMEGKIPYFQKEIRDVYEKGVRI